MPYNTGHVGYMAGGLLFETIDIALLSCISWDAEHGTARWLTCESWSTCVVVCLKVDDST